MSNVIPYFVLAVVALGFFAICYAVFNRTDSESQSKHEHRDKAFLSLMVNIIKISRFRLMNLR